MSAFVDELNEKQEFVDKVIMDLDIDVHTLLEVPLRRALTSRGKRLRPLICMLCAEVAGGDYKATRDAFLALELIHNGTLIHDDIIDEDAFRRGSASIHTEFGGKRAVLTGDALLSLGLRYATRTGKLSIVNWLSGTALKMVQGVALQTYHRRQVVSEDTYLSTIYLKSGSLFEAAAALGGLTSCDDGEVVDALAQFGKNFGIAYQIRDDISDVFNADNLTRSDILNGDVTLPFIYALESERISGDDKNDLMEMFQGRMELIDYERVQRIYSETGALERSIARMKEYAKKSRENLKPFGRSGARDCIDHLLDKYYGDFDPRDRLKSLV